MSYVAQSLAMEIDHRLPWSLDEYSPEQLSLLFDSRELFQKIPDGYAINPWQAGMILLSAPDDVSAFIEGRIGKNRLGTIVSVLEWARENLVHFEGAPTARNMEDQWQYRGFPPIERVLSGTPFSGRDEPSVVHRIAGCQGAAGFLRAVLRTANIPTKIIRVCRHALVSFPTEGKYLSHGDDPYHLRALSSHCSSSQLLIDRETFAAWFESGQAQDRCGNVGRAAKEIPMKACHAR